MRHQIWWPNLNRENCWFNRSWYGFLMDGWIVQHIQLLFNSFGFVTWLTVLSFTAAGLVDYVEALVRRRETDYNV